MLIYDAVKDEWHAKEGIPFMVPVTTTAINWGNSVVIPGGEIKPGVRSADILLGKISWH